MRCKSLATKLRTLRAEVEREFRAVAGRDNGALGMAPEIPRGNKVEASRLLPYRGERNSISLINLTSNYALKFFDNKRWCE